MGTVSGTVLDAAGSPVVRTLRVYRRDTGVLLDETTSNGATGMYSVTTSYAGEVQVVMLDDLSGTIENDQILRTTPV